MSGINPKVFFKFINTNLNSNKSEILKEQYIRAIGPISQFIEENPIYIQSLLPIQAKNLQNNLSIMQPLEGCQESLDKIQKIDTLMNANNF